MKDISRRDAIKILGAGTVTTLGGFTGSASSQQPALSDGLTPESVKKLMTAQTTTTPAVTQIVFDAHSHFFNVTDLQAGGYIVRPILNEGLDIPVSGPVRRFVDRFGEAVQKHIGKLAPNAIKEFEEIKALNQNNNNKSRKQLALAVKSVDQLLDENINNFFDVLEQDDKRQLKQISDAYKSAQDLDTQYFQNISAVKSRSTSEEFTRDAFKELSREPSHSNITDKSLKSFNNPLSNAKTKIGSFLRFAKHMLGSRLDNVTAYQKIYSQSKDASVVHALDVTCDFDLWLGCDDTVSSMQSQVDLHEEMHKFLGGFNVPVLGVNPWKIVRDKDNVYKDFVESTLKRGVFRGVKLYPPIGYSVTGEIMKDIYECRNISSPTPVQLAKAFIELFDIVEGTQTVVMAHTTHSKGATRLSRELGGPRYWKELAQNRPNLKINLGHMGGEDNLKNWNSEFLSMMSEKSQSVYGDFGYWPELMDRENLVKFLHNLDTNSRPALFEKIMYGSDWFMTSSKPWSNLYLQEIYQNFRAEMKAENLTSNQLHSIFYGNAAKLFGVS